MNFSLQELVKSGAVTESQYDDEHSVEEYLEGYFSPSFVLEALRIPFSDSISSQFQDS